MLLFVMWHLVEAIRLAQSTGGGLNTSALGKGTSTARAAAASAAAQYPPFMDMHFAGVGTPAFTDSPMIDFDHNGCALH